MACISDSDEFFCLLADNLGDLIFLTGAMWNVPIVPTLESDRREGGSVSDLQLFKYVVKMYLDGAVRDVQSTAYFFVGQSF